MKHILIPTDFSDNAYNALNYAKTLFSNDAATFYLMHVYISTSSNLISSEQHTSILDGMSDNEEQDLKDFLNIARKENNNGQHFFQIISKTGSLVKEMNAAILTNKIDFVVMGTKGAKGSKEVFLGSNAVKVINGIENCPVVVVPQNYQSKLPSVIAFSTNFKRAFVEKELKPLIDIAIANNSKINIARIMQEEYLTDRQKENKETLKSLFNNLDYIFCKIDVETSETNALKDFAKYTESDLIALIHHKHNFFQKLLEEDVVDKISFNSPLPLLILSEWK
ncbi:universal stress protein [Aquimarina sp. SS2-1]|uniref:universal stress protein n=1 Tax=Aquimarina besae TaxID=3342247 RepID=UPI0036701A46